ncbi:MAG: DUF1385 domain-containing protein [Candidatus Dormibacteria bacterium]
MTIAVNAANAPPAPFFYGGQAVIEGVLMRGPRHFAVAARRPDGSITVLSEPLRSRVYTSSVWRQPFLRGVAGLYEMLNLGMRALSWSANVQLGEQAQISRKTMRSTIAGSVVFGLLLFLGIPLLLARAVRGGDSARSVRQILLEGVIRAVVLLTYLFLIGRVSNVARVFAYHGAEHKAINALEAGLPSDVASVRGSSRLHPRCGTGFIVVVAFVSIVVFAPLGTLPVVLRLLIQILLVPVVAGISYEAIRGLARIRHTAAGRTALVPILAAQRLTTREPDDSQIEVAIAALDAARMGDTIVGEQHDPLII